MSFLPFGHVSSFPVPIKLSRIQMRLAIELGAQKAAQAELQRQLGEAIGVPADTIRIEGASVDFQMNSFPTPDLGGIPIEWVD